MIGNKYKATVILGIVSVGFFVSYPFQHTLIGGILTGGFGAAMIGGFADWFAVSALFRRPLGIPFRTAIVPRNREKIFQSLVHMVENQLLMKENIKSRLNERDLSAILIKIMVEHGGKNIIKRMLYGLIREILGQVNPKEVGKIIDEMVKNTIAKTPMTLYILSGAEWLIKNNYDDKLIKFFLKQCILLVGHKQVNYLFAQGFILAQQRYEQGMMRRKFFNQLLNLAPEEVGSMGQQALKASLIAMQDEQHTLRQKLRVWLQQWLVAKKTDPLFQKNIDKWIHKLLDTIDFDQHIAQYIANFCERAVVDQRQTVKWLDQLSRHFDQALAKFVENQQERATFNIRVQNMLGRWLDTYHDEIGKTVRNSLNNFTDEMLVSFIENKVGNDLQMIRINGSVVGGLVGVVLYVVTSWL